MELKVKKLHKDAKLPEFKTKGAAGFDLSCVEDFEIKPGEFKLISTGLAFEIPDGFEMQIRPRSGLALKHGISVLNTPGTIDSDYRGEVKVILINFSKEVFSAKKGSRIAQAVISKVYQPKIIEVDELSKTQRDKNGFGSTGI